MWNMDLIFVHGAWQGPWAFRSWSAYFAGEGWAVKSLTLPGHGPGDTPSGVGLAECVAAVRGAVDDPSRTVLVGHGAGGWIVLKVLESLPVAASVLLAPLPHGGLSLRKEAALARLAPALALRCLVRRSPVTLEGGELARKLFFSPETDEARLKRFLAALGPESPRLLRQLLLLPLRVPGSPKIRARKVRKKQRGRPHLVVASEADILVTPEELAGTARLLGAEMLRLASSPHQFTLEEGSLKVAEAVRGWLEERLETASEFLDK